MEAPKRLTARNDSARSAFSEQCQSFNTVAIFRNELAASVSGAAREQESLVGSRET
jgi:hypothetical protein